MTSNVMRNQPPTPSEFGMANISTVKTMAEDLHDFIGRLGPSREFSIAKTKLEEAAMWAVKGIAIQDETVPAASREG